MRQGASVHSILTELTEFDVKLFPFFVYQPNNIKWETNNWLIFQLAYLP